jgi:hypothetical protein
LSVVAFSMVSPIKYCCTSADAESVTNIYYYFKQNDVPPSDFERDDGICVTEKGMPLI